jgi:aldose 1-epimerase
MKRLLSFFLLSVSACTASHYSATRITDHGFPVVRLADQSQEVEVLIAPSVGNRAYALKVAGKNLLYFPSSDIAAFEKAGAKGLNGIPFLAPWANRMAGGGFWADGKRYTFNPDVGTVRVDPNGISIHGLLTASKLWEVTDVGADKHSAHVTSRLQFWKYPELMANWPFAHEYEMTYRLSEGELEVITTVRNLSAESMPVSIGYHPYFEIPDVPRSETDVHIAAHMQVETDSNLVATGELKPVQFPDRISLRDHTFDNGFTSLERDAGGYATFTFEAGPKRIQVIYGPQFKVAVVYAPPGQDFVCFEPMTAITNGVNLAHAGKYSELQSIAPGASWRETFKVRFSGF